MNRYLLFLIGLVMSSFVIGQNVQLSLQNFNDDSGSVDIYMVNEVDVAGFQFNISGFDNISASGGSATDNGFKDEMRT